MKRLFCVMRGKKLIHAQETDGTVTTYYDSKEEAKAMRDTLNSDIANEFRVSRGPDNLKSAKPNHRAISSLAQKWQRGNRGHL